MNILKIFLLFLVLAGNLWADRDGGPYVGVGYGVSKYYDDGLYTDFKNNKSGSMIVYGGAYINKHLSVEIDYASFDAWYIDKGYEINDTKTINCGATTVNTLAHYAFFDDILDFYAKFGVGQLDESGIKDGGFTLSYGGGVDVRFNELFSMRVAYDRYTFEYKDRVSGDYDLYIDFMYGAVEFQF